MGGASGGQDRSLYMQMAGTVENLCAEKGRKETDKRAELKRKHNTRAPVFAVGLFRFWSNWTFDAPLGQFGSSGPTPIRYFPSALSGPLRRALLLNSSIPTALVISCRDKADRPVLGVV
jgi:hypothetical protein